MSYDSFGISYRMFLAWCTGSRFLSEVSFVCIKDASLDAHRNVALRLPFATHPASQAILLLTCRMLNEGLANLLKEDCGVDLCGAYAILCLAVPLKQAQISILLLYIELLSLTISHMLFRSLTSKGDQTSTIGLLGICSSASLHHSLYTISPMPILLKTMSWRLSLSWPIHESACCKSRMYDVC